MDSVSIMNITQNYIKKELDTALRSQDLYIKIKSVARAKGLLEYSLSLLSALEYIKILDWWEDIKKTYSPLLRESLETGG